MINPQMYGTELPQVPSIKELWKNEKSQYRQWILLFGIGIAVVFALMLTSLIINLSSQDSIRAILAKQALEFKSLSFDGKADWVDSTWKQTYMIFPILKTSFVGVGFLFFMVTVIDSYRNKSFAKLSSLATMVIGIGTFIAIFTLFKMAWSQGARTMLDPGIPGGIFSFVTNFLVIGVYFGASVKISRIRRVFATSVRVEALKNDPNYQAQMQQFRNMQDGKGFTNNSASPFSPAGAGTAQGAATSTGPNPNAIVTPVVEEVSQERKDLEGMTIKQLVEVANKLSISGSEKMTKKELIENILRVTSSK